MSGLVVAKNGICGLWVKQMVQNDTAPLTAISWIMTSIQLWRSDVNIIDILVGAFLGFALAIVFYPTIHH